MVILRAEKLVLSLIHIMVRNVLLLYLILIVILIFIKAHLVIYMYIRLGHFSVLKRIVCDFEFLRFLRYPAVVKLPLPIVFLVGVAFLLLWLLLLRRNFNSSDCF